MVHPKKNRFDSQEKLTSKCTKFKTVLAVIGITVEGQPEVLAFRVSERENQLAWEDLMDDLKQRGVEKVG